MQQTYQTLKCESCGNIFVWSNEEERLYQKRNLPKPRYCAICRGIMEAKNADLARQKFEKNVKKELYE